MKGFDCHKHRASGSNYIDKQHLRTNYKDIEDFAGLHIRFEDNTIADIFAAAETIMTIYSAYLSAEKNGAEVEIPQV